jgi:probable rRNA maturation factor
MILNALDLPDSELSIVLTDDPGITRLNKQYLNRDHSTNVISFPQLEGEFAQLNLNILGDVVVSVDTAQKEAEIAEKSLEWALIRLIIHGILHLTGYDHEAEGSDAQAMEDKSQELMNLVLQ